MLGRWRSVRETTARLASRLAPEDMVLQSMPDASPTKWHLAHTTWFFEEFVLAQIDPGAKRHHPEYAFLFNSYYEAVGQRHARDRRGMLSRPSVDEVLAYRKAIDEKLARAMEGELSREILDRIELGIHHEMQHQELLLTDIKHALFQNPTMPVYRTRARTKSKASPLAWHACEGGLVEIGATKQGFAFDNERPRHRVFLEPFEIASRLVTCGEYLEFIRDGGYRRPELWLSEGFGKADVQGPLYWIDDERVYTLNGVMDLDPDEPICHVSHFEADAFARWAGARLPTEAEWELAASKEEMHGHFLEDDVLHPTPGDSVFGDTWIWTQSAYAPYPGFAPLAGALGEYNGKFMSSQMVLRGGSCLSARDHIRATYRNFFPSAARWQMTGIRLAR